MPSSRRGMLDQFSAAIEKLYAAADQTTGQPRPLDVRSCDAFDCLVGEPSLTVAAANVCFVESGRKRRHVVTNSGVEALVATGSRHPRKSATRPVIAAPDEPPSPPTALLPQHSEFTIKKAVFEIVVVTIGVLLALIVDEARQ
jgi:hypothetical protein